MKTVPADFTYKEMVTVLRAFGFRESNKGKTSGSRVKFAKEDFEIILHKPHPGNEIKRSYVKEIVKQLKKEGLL